ncbi:MAG: methylmalonyl-CoA epimerase [Halanaerobiales bacterium]|nr:methylmalonyl-CoA epimerase [Halanaerobiales bacterium]
MKIDHIGIAVKDIQNSLKFYRDVLGLEFNGIEKLNDRGLQVAFLQIGESEIELLEPISEDSTIFKFIEKKGEGIHHIALEVDNVDNKIDEINKLGAKIIGKPSSGAGGKKIVFIHPKSTSGVLMELCQHQ